jgi:hypothetical protein
MAHSLGKTFGWWLTHEESHQDYVVWLLTHAGPFVVNLPAGQYRVTRIAYDESAGVWEGSLPATFMVHAGQAAYLGTWEIQFGFLGRAGKIYGRVVDQIEQARDELRHTYTGPPKPIAVSLLESAREGFLSLTTLRVN